MNSSESVDLNEVISALMELGGEADSSDIKKKIHENRNRIMPSGYSYWESYQNTIDQVIQQHCPECEKFNGRTARFEQVKRGRYKLITHKNIDSSSQSVSSRDVIIRKKSKPDKSQENGGGFGTPETNEEVESSAVRYVTKWYNSNGWEVESVENQKCGFDLICTKNGIQENVEVKGVSGKYCSFIITAGEVRQSEANPKFVICIVTNALSTNPNLYRCSGTEFLERFSIEPIQYKAKLK